MKKMLLIILGAAMPMSLQATLFITAFDNADFESGGAVGTFSNSVIDWAEGDVTNYGVSFTQDEDSSSAVPLDGTDTDGDDNWGGFAYREDTNTAGSGELYQQIGTFTANESYDFTMNVGYRSDRGWGNLVVTLFTSGLGTGVADADTLDGSRSSSLTDYSVLDTFTYTTTPDTGDGDAIAFSLDGGISGTNGNPLWVAFSIANGSNGTSARQIFIDDVTAVVVPEPGSALLLGAGILGLVTLRRRSAAA